MSEKVVLHVGAPKTGTSFLQELLFENRDALAARGILYPADRFDAHFLAALDLMELRWGGLEREAVGAWEELARRVREWPGTALISHEILATASPTQVALALESLGDAEVHVVVSARDLVRQIPAEWQENVKHRRILGYRDFLDQITDPRRDGTVASWFWAVQDVPSIAERWGATLPPERVHLVTVPPRGAPSTVLWERFAGVLGLDPASYDSQSRRANPSLGVAEAALVRRINEEVNARGLPGPDYRDLVRETLAHRLLAQRGGATRLTVPEDVRTWAAALCESWIEALGTRGYDVVGDLSELRPRDDTLLAFADPDRPDEAEVADAAVEAVITLVEEAARRGHEIARLGQELEGAWAELERSRGLVFRVKRRLVLLGEHHAALGLALRAYRRVRGSSSRSA